MKHSLWTLPVGLLALCHIKIAPFKLKLLLQDQVPFGLSFAKALVSKFHGEVRLYQSTIQRQKARLK